MFQRSKIIEVNGSPSTRLLKLQRSGVQLSERLASLGIMEEITSASPETPLQHSAVMFERFQWGPQLCSHDVEICKSLGQLRPIVVDSKVWTSGSDLQAVKHDHRHPSYIEGKFATAPMGKEKKKTHSQFHCDQTNVSRFKIGGTNFGSLVYEQEGEFLENSKKHL